MHPAQFAKEVRFQLHEWDMGCCNDKEIREKFLQVHPLNFIRAQIKIPVFKCVISYFTNKGNYKTVERYMVFDNTKIPDDIGEDFYAEIELEGRIDDYNSRNPERKLNNWEILSVKKLCDAVLPIG